MPESRLVREFFCKNLERDILDDKPIVTADFDQGKMVFYLEYSGINWYEFNLAIAKLISFLGKYI